MTKEQMTDVDLDALLAKPLVVADNGFSDDVLKAMAKHAKIALIIPFVFGLVGALITYFAVPTGWFNKVFGDAGLSGITFDRGFIGEMSILPLIAISFLVLWGMFAALVARN